MNSEQQQTHVQALFCTVQAYISQGDGPSALSTLLQAVQLLGGPTESARVAEHFQNSFTQQAQAIDALSALTGRLQAVSLAAQPLTSHLEDVRASEHTLGATTGVDAAMTGSGLQLRAEDDALHLARQQSYVCNMCGGVVALSRQAQHQSQWCPTLADPAGR